MNLSMVRALAWLWPLLVLPSLGTTTAGEEPPQPADGVEAVAASLGTGAVLRCPLEFAGGLVRPYVVRWFKHGARDPIYLWQEGEKPHVQDAFASRLTLVGPASLALHDVREEDFGWYRCHVTVQGDAEGDDVRTVTWVVLESTEIDLRFIEEPQSVIVRPTDEVILRCVTSSPSTKLTWTKDDRPVDEERFTVVGGVLTVRPNVGGGDSSGSYRCVARVADVTLSSAPAHVQVAAMQPFPTFSDLTVEAAEGNVAVFPCHVPRSLPESVTRITRNGHGSVLERFERLQNGDFLVQSVRKSDEGVYQCSAENAFLNVTVEAPWKIHLVVTVPEDPLPAQLVVTPKKYLAVPLHGNVTLECRANGTPLPTIKWSKYGGDLPQQRHMQRMGTLTLNDIQNGDEGTYVCQAENGHGRPVTSFTILKIQKHPSLVRELRTQNQTVTEGTTVVLDCTCKGEPEPTITWVHNGDTLKANDRTVVKDSKLIMKKVLLHHSGTYQCFASNDVGTVRSVARLRVYPTIFPSMADGQKDFGGSDSDIPLTATGQVPQQGGKNAAATQPPVVKHDRQGSRKPKPNAATSRDKMVPPSKPEITKLSDESVMVRWTVPENDGLPISFFKLQYKDVSRVNSRWMTMDEEIAAHIHSFEVSNLKLGHHYKFRIAAVYSNNDNKPGMNSAKFHLQKDPPMKMPTTGPTIIHAEAVGPTAILIRWEYVSIDMIPIEGFFIHYRETTSAGSYHKVTVIGGRTDKHIITHLQPKVTYEIKMQCFNLAGTSDFSNIWTQATLDYPYSRSDTETQVATTAPVYQACNETAYMVLSVTLGILVVILLMVLFVYARKQCHRHQTSDMVVHTIRKYDDSFRPTEFELQSLTGVKSLNGNTSPSPNGHFLTNGCVTVKPPIGLDLDVEDEESSIGQQTTRSSAIPCKQCATDDQGLEVTSAAPRERSEQSTDSKLRLSTFGKSDGGCGAKEPLSLT